ncbi:aminoadipate-semialdehyde dehydrogenase [Musca autumnalis]|uniref:aminoadipate-semialdehyde dehydrogenase n=1 Tax=Musca autumnalis TaxID=221902 RepID=UPI003CF22188
MSTCFSLNHLKQFSGNIFTKETKYASVIDEIRTCLKFFQDHDIKTQGIAIDITEHSLESCTLILSVLNHGCHFFCEDLKCKKNVISLLRLSGVEYVISTDAKNLNTELFQVYEGFTIFAKTYFIGKIKAISTTSVSRQVDICYTINTSGSTGTPKIVHVPFNCIYPNIKSLCYILEITERDKVLLGSPPTFDPFIVELFMTLEKGASLVILNRALRIIPDIEVLQDVTIIQTTPSVFRSFGIHIIQDLFLSKTSLRCLLLGGEEFPSMQEIQLWLHKQRKPLPNKSVRIFNIYGITEYSCWATIHEYNHQQCLNGSDSTALGKPLDDTTHIQINDIDNDTPLPSDRPGRGELLIGSSVRRCYIPCIDNDIDAWKKKETIFRRTGDLIERDGIGDYYYIGRLNNCIKRLGKRLCLDSLENKFDKVLNCKTICLWHEESKRLLVCFKISKNDLIIKNRNLHSLLKDRFYDYEQPDQICYVNEIPLSKHGKVDRKKLLQDILMMTPQTPSALFESFLDNVLGLSNAKHIDSNESKNKRLKCSLDLSFIAAGGTSFHALSLSTHIGEIMKSPEKQRILLEMLLKTESTLQNIIDFLNADTLTTSMPTSFVDEYQNYSFSNLFNIKLLWRANLKKCVDASPSILRENIVSVGSHSHLVVSFDTKTGEEISRLKLSDRIECPVVFVSDDLAAVGCYDGILYGFNFRNGEISWQFNVNGMIKTKPIVTKELLIVASYAEDFNIHAFNMKTLSLVWKFKLGSKGIFSSPLKISDEAILFCNLDGYYALIESTSGSTKWIKKLESPIFSSPAQLNTENKDLVLADVSGRVVVCNKENGDEITHFQADGNIFSSITLREQSTNNKWLIFFGCHDKNVYCLSYEPTALQLSLLWRFVLNAPIYSTPIIAFKDTILACSTKGTIVLIDLQSSQLKGRYEINAEIFSTPCISDNKYIYIGSRDNFLYALEVQ